MKFKIESKLIPKLNCKIKKYKYKIKSQLISTIYITRKKLFRDQYLATK